MTHYGETDRHTVAGDDLREPCECALCGQEIEKDWGEHPPRPQCFGCSQAHTEAIEDYGSNE